MYINGMCISDLKNKTYYLENCRKSNRGNKGTLYSEKTTAGNFCIIYQK